MANVTIDLLYNELKQVHRELHELNAFFIEEESASQKERKEIHSTLSEMRKGKEKNWRKLPKK